MAMEFNINIYKNFAECGVSPVSVLSDKILNSKNLTKVYAADDDDTGKVAHMSRFCCQSTLGIILPVFRCFVYVSIMEIRRFPSYRYKPKYCDVFDKLTLILNPDLTVPICLL